MLAAGTPRDTHLNHQQHNHGTGQGSQLAVAIVHKGIQRPSITIKQGAWSIQSDILPCGCTIHEDAQCGACCDLFCVSNEPAANTHAHLISRHPFTYLACHNKGSLLGTAPCLRPWPMMIQGALRSCIPCLHKILCMASPQSESCTHATRYVLLHNQKRQMTLPHPGNATSEFY